MSAPLRTGSQYSTNFDSPDGRVHDPPVVYGSRFSYAEPRRTKNNLSYKFARLQTADGAFLCKTEYFYINIDIL